MKQAKRYLRCDEIAMLLGRGVPRVNTADRPVWAENGEQMNECSLSLCDAGPRANSARPTRAEPRRSTDGRAVSHPLNSNC